MAVRDSPSQERGAGDRQGSCVPGMFFLGLWRRWGKKGAYPWCHPTNAIVTSENGWKPHNCFKLPSVYLFTFPVANQSIFPFIYLFFFVIYLICNVVDRFVMVDSPREGGAPGACRAKLVSDVVRSELCSTEAGRAQSV